MQNESKANKCYYHRKNAKQTLLECLNSLKDFDEIILLNNESSDNTLNIANEFKKILLICTFTTVLL